MEFAVFNVLRIPYSVKVSPSTQYAIKDEWQKLLDTNEIRD